MNGKSVRWVVEIMHPGSNDVLSFAPTNQMEAHLISKNYKKSLKLYNQAKKAYPRSRIWFVGIDNRHNMKNIFFYKGLQKGKRSKEFTEEELWRATKKQVGLTPKKEKEYHKREVERIKRRVEQISKIQKGDLVEIIRKEERMYNGPVPRFELKEKYGVTDRQIEELKMKGDIFEPRTGFVMVI